MAVKEHPALSCKLAIAASIITTTVGCVGFDLGFLVFAAFTDFGSGMAFGSSTAASMASQGQSFNDIYFVIGCNINLDGG